jgi:hypothetical protein
MRRWWMLALAGAVALAFPACGEGGGAAEADVSGADVAEAEMTWASIGAPLLGGFMKVESYGCREDAIFVAVSGGEKNNIFKLELDDVAGGWKNLNDQSAQLEPIEDHLILAFPEGKT